MIDAQNAGVKPNIPVNSKGWSDFDAALRRNGIVEPQAHWYVTWVKLFKSTAPAVPLGDRTLADVERFLTAQIENSHLESWKIDQASEALRVLYQEVIAAPWARPWIRPARALGKTVVKKKTPPAATPEEEPLLLRSGWCANFWNGWPRSISSRPARRTRP